jgi:hypothetical protein
VRFSNRSSLKHGQPAPYAGVGPNRRSSFTAKAIEALPRPETCWSQTGSNRSQTDRFQRSKLSSFAAWLIGRYEGWRGRRLLNLRPSLTRKPAQLVMGKNAALVTNLVIGG